MRNICIRANVKPSRETNYYSSEMDRALRASVCCWHCAHTVDANMYHLPYAHDTLTDMYTVHGYFCCPQCVKAYILEKMTSPPAYNLNLFERMMSSVYGCTESIVAAPPREALTRFGGPIEWPSHGVTTPECVLVTHPFISHTMVIQERLPPKDHANDLLDTMAVDACHDDGVITQPTERAAFELFMQERSHNSDKNDAHTSVTSECASSFSTQTSDVGKPKTASTTLRRFAKQKNATSST